MTPILQMRKLRTQSSNFLKSHIMQTALFAEPVLWQTTIHDFQSRCTVKLYSERNQLATSLKGNWVTAQLRKMRTWVGGSSLRLRPGPVDDFPAFSLKRLCSLFNSFGMCLLFFYYSFCLSSVALHSQLSSLSIFFLASAADWKYFRSTLLHGISLKIIQVKLVALELASEEQQLVQSLESGMGAPSWLFKQNPSVRPCIRWWGCPDQWRWV